MLKEKRKNNKNIVGVSCCLYICCVILICLSHTFSAYAKDYTFSWTANPESVDGYKLYYKKGGDPVQPFDGVDSANGTSPIDVGKQTTYTITGLDENATYHFSLTAYKSSSESGFSEVVTVLPTVAAPEPVVAVINASVTKGEAPLVTSFDGSGSSGPVEKYLWMFGDGETASGSSATHVYQLSGTYSLSLTVQDVSGVSDETKLVITVTEPVAPPSEPEPPLAVLSSSAAVGNAPLAVQFDGSGSSSKQPPIISYSWGFGDGSNASGAVVSHTYSVAGSYESKLDVTDSVGLTGQASTPIIVSKASTSLVNKQPISSFSAIPESGPSPLIVKFDGRSSTDPDGFIISYAWNFGDGSTAKDISPRHTYLKEGYYYASLTVTDDRNKTRSSGELIKALKPQPEELSPHFEMWEVNVGSTWKTVSFEKPFVEPIIVAGPPGINGTSPAIIRVRNVKGSGFEIRIQEWDYLDDSHATEQFSFLVMEKGAYTLADGTKIEAGKFSGNANFQSITLQQKYLALPVVLTQVVTVNGSNAVTGRLRNVSQRAFEYKLQNQESAKTSPTSETVNYIALEQGIGTLAGIPYEAAVTAQEVTDGWYNIAYTKKFPAPPLFIAEIQTSEGQETAALRSSNLSADSVLVKVEEETSADDETNHADERVGYFVIGEE